MQVQLLEQAHRLRFDDPAVEAAYRADRNERDALRVQRMLLLVVVTLVTVGTVIIGLNRTEHLPVSGQWLLMRFGVIVPTLLVMAMMARRPWGRDHLQPMVALGLALSAGVYGLEWVADWTSAMPPRALWVVPCLALFAMVMALPMSTKSVIGATIGAFGISTGGVVAILPRVGGELLAANIIVYVLAVYILAATARFREREWRASFVHRREVQLLTEKLRTQNESLTQLNKLRDEFVAGVLHDLRSPLTGVILAADMMRENPAMPPEGQTRLLDQISHSARHIDTFASHFLDQRSLERAGAKFTLTNVPLDLAIDRVVTRARLPAGKKKQSIVLDLMPPLTAVAADELLLDRALANLLDNAMKYSPAGTAVTVRVTADAAVTGHVRIAVIDSGPGLSAEERTRLFQPYTRLDKKVTGGEPSTGLGLSLVKQWIDAMGGAVGCESEPGEGTTFWLSLRRA